MECTVSWTGATGTRSGMGFLAETGSGHTFMMDGAPDAAKPETAARTWRPGPWKPCWPAPAAAPPMTWC
jgi:putative redox protein